MGHHGIGAHGIAGGDRRKQQLRLGKVMQRHDVVTGQGGQPCAKPEQIARCGLPDKGEQRQQRGREL